MNIWLALTLLIVLLIVFSLITLLLVKWMTTQQKNLTEFMTNQQNQQNQILSQTINFLSVKDPLAYQQVAASQTPSISSEEYVSMGDGAEARRFEELVGQDMLPGVIMGYGEDNEYDSSDREALADLGFRQ